MATVSLLTQITADEIVDTVREPLLVLDTELKVRRGNRAFYQLFRMTPEETEGRPIYELNDRQWDIPALRILLEDILPQNKCFNDFEILHEFGTVGMRILLLNGRRVYRGPQRTEYILLAMEDITERRRMEKQRAELETRFTSLLENLRDHSILTLDPEGYITSWNREAEKILGFTEVEAIGQHFSIIFTPEDLQTGIPALELSIARKDGRAEDERWHTRKGGERFWALGILTPTQDANGVHTGYCKILRDMTDRKQAQDGREQADERKDEFLATLAHELRNKLAPIRNGLELLKLTTDTLIREQSREMMERQLVQMLRLVDDLLDISRVTQNKLELRKTTVELSTIVQNAIETARPLIEAGGHTLAVSIPPWPIHLHADPLRMARIFENLLNNTAKFTPPDGQISVVVECEESEITVTVKGSGIGISPDSLPRLFETFSQVDRNLEGTQGGLSIGLAHAKIFTEAHGGKVEVRSDGQGEGYTYIVRLPIMAEGQSENRRNVKGSPPASTNRILIVDDNRDGAASLAMLLKVLGNEIHTAHDGLQGVEMAESFKPDAIVLDIGLPQLNGYEVCRRIRAQPWGKQILIVAATGWGQEEDRRRSKEAGFDHHFVKPVDAAQFVNLLLKRAT